MEAEILVSILMSVYNAEKYVEEAIESMLSQTWRNFELIIFDDASTDSSYEKICNFQDERIIVIKNKKNVGLTKNLNRGLKMAKGKYIARMDADDISLPQRLEKQVAYMESHKDIALASCSSISFGGERAKNVIRLDSTQIKGRLVFWSVLPHPGFIFRRSLFTRCGIEYNEGMKYAQDYDFQSRVAKKYKIACLSDILLEYRVSEKQISAEKYEEQQMYANRVRVRQFQEYGVRLRTKDAKIIQKMCLDKLDELSNVQLFRAVFILIELVCRAKLGKYEEWRYIWKLGKEFIVKSERALWSKYC